MRTGVAEIRQNQQAAPSTWHRKDQRFEINEKPHNSGEFQTRWYPNKFEVLYLKEKNTTKKTLKAWNSKKWDTFIPVPIIGKMLYQFLPSSCSKNPSKTRNRLPHGLVTPPPWGSWHEPWLQEAILKWFVACGGMFRPQVEVEVKKFINIKHISSMYSIIFDDRNWLFLYFLLGNWTNINEGAVHHFLAEVEKGPVEPREGRTPIPGKNPPNPFE